MYKKVRMNGSNGKRCLLAVESTLQIALLINLITCIMHVV